MKRKFQVFFAGLLAAILTVTIPLKSIEARAENTDSLSSDVSDYKIQNNFDEGIILKACNWSFNNILNKLSDIKSAGYKIIEVSQVQEYIN